MPLQLTRATLARAVGVPGLVRVIEPTPPVSQGEGYDHLVEEAYSHRQDLRAQVAGVEVVRERKNQVLARYAPQVNTQWVYPRLDTPTFANRDTKEVFGDLAATSKTLWDNIDPDDFVREQREDRQ